jgi:small subunit ribosomal protein S8
MTNPIADTLIRIRNAQMINAEHVVMPASKLRLQIANTLKDAGYLAGVERKKRKINKSEREFIDLQFKYDEKDKENVISDMKLVSKPSRHIYIRAKDIRPVRSGYGIAVMSTSEGVMSSVEARKKNIGGEILFEIW